MTKNRHLPWRAEEVETVERMLAEGADVREIGRALRRPQTDVAAQVFALRTAKGR